ncbi:MAG: hypothetical protein IT373_18825 [Polyangiaceae bacterium]|nr:hypothetical protein [Polyangiaceae bacterium]
MKRFVFAALVAVALAGCGKAGSNEQKANITPAQQDFDDLCHSFERSGAKSGDFATAHAWYEGKMRDPISKDGWKYVKDQPPAERYENFANDLKTFGIPAERCPYSQELAKAAGK